MTLKTAEEIGVAIYTALGCFDEPSLHLIIQAILARDEEVRAAARAEAFWEAHTEAVDRPNEDSELCSILAAKAEAESK